MQLFWRSHLTLCPWQGDTAAMLCCPGLNRRAPGVSSWDSHKPEQSLNLMASAGVEQGLPALLLWLSQHLLPSSPPPPVQCRPQGQPVRWRHSAQSRKRQPQSSGSFSTKFRVRDSERPQSLKVSHNCEQPHKSQPSRVQDAMTSHIGWETRLSPGMGSWVTILCHLPH